VGIDHEGIGHEVVQALSGPAVEHEQVKAAQRATEHDQRDQPVCDDLQRRREGDVQSERRAVQGPGDREDREAQRRACRSDRLPERRTTRMRRSSLGRVGVMHLCAPNAER
jgi:hypothetical protein